jgi:hypothetical protein
VTGTETALIISACGTFLTALTSAYGVMVSQRNSRTLQELHASTNGLSERNEAIAKKLGIAEGKATERARHE